MKKITMALLLISISLIFTACLPFGMRNNVINPSSHTDDYYGDDYYDDYYDDDYYGDDYYDDDYYDDDYYGDDYYDDYDDYGYGDAYYYTGTYVCDDDSMYSPGYYPTLYLYNDGSFYFEVNLGDGMGSIWGYYSEDTPGYIELYVDGRDFSGYAGDNEEIIPFYIVDDYTLRLHEKNIGLTSANSYFYYSY